MSNPGIYVCGTPRGGTSCVAGILHHLGVDMGECSSTQAHGYKVYEDIRAKGFTRPMWRNKGDEVISFIGGGANATRDFRAYLEAREEEANGRPWGCKLGTNYPISELDPATLPVKWVFVDRPLEDSIRSDLAKTKPEGRKQIWRSMQIAGYWASKEWLKTVHPEALRIEFSYPDSAWLLGAKPVDVIDRIVARLDLEPTDKQFAAALDSIDTDKVHTWAAAS